MAESGWGIISTLKRVRVRKRVKEKDISKIKKHDRVVKDLNKINVKETGQGRSSSNIYSGIKVKIDEDKKPVEPEKNTQTETEEEIEDSKPANMLTFDHQVTEFEFKLKYMNLKDTFGNEYGRDFPPIQSRLVILDEEGRKFIITKAGNNQISGNLLSFFKANDISPGDVIIFEYDRDEISEDGKHVLHLKIKKKE